MKTLRVIRPGTIHYDEAFSLQLRLVEEVIHRGDGSLGYLLLLQHPPVITIGRSGSRDNILVGDEELQRRGIDVRESNRGGDVTYHARGQVVGYPIISLRPFGRDIHGYLRRLEGVIIAALAGYGIRATRIAGRTGVWVARDEAAPRKIASIGVAVRRWVAYHGFALNVSIDPREFEIIRACGIEGVQMTSMERELGKPLDCDAVADTLCECFAGEFGFEVEPISPAACAGEVRK